MRPRISSHTHTHTRHCFLVLYVRLMKGDQGTRGRLTASTRCWNLPIRTEPSEMASLSRATNPSCHPIRSGYQCPPWLVCWTLSGAFVRGVELPCTKLMGEGWAFTGYPDLLWSHVSQSRTYTYIQIMHMDALLHFVEVLLGDLSE